MTDKEWLTGELKQEHLEEVYKLLADALPSQAVKRAETASIKGYDTIGHRAQFIINRLNEAVGIGHWQVEIKEREELSFVVKKENKDEKTRWYATIQIVLQLGNWRAGQRNGAGLNWFDVVAARPGTGGSDNAQRGDAAQGAMSGALKRAAGLFGAGKAAYEGSLGEEGTAPDEEKKNAEAELIYEMCKKQEIDRELFDEWAFGHYDITQLPDLHIDTLTAMREKVENNPEGCKKTISEYLDKRK